MLLGPLAVCATLVAQASGSDAAAPTAEAAIAASAKPAPCRDAPAIVTGQVATDVRLACEGAADVARFLAPLALAEGLVVPVDIVPVLPPDLRRDAVGCYSKASRRVSVLTLQAFLARGTWFGVPTDASLYRSIVAHEVAHAMVGCHLASRELPTAAHEYLAYVTMFATMAPATRERALQAMPGDGMGHAAEINDFRYALDPMRFGVDAWRHWTRQPDGVGFLAELLRGGLVPDLRLPP